MIQPEDIRRKAENLYPDYLQAWLNGDEDFFPRIIPARKTPDGDDLAATIRAVHRLREGSKEETGFGYTVHWREANSRKFGAIGFQPVFSLRPRTISFASRESSANPVCFETRWPVSARHARRWKRGFGQTCEH